MQADNVSTAQNPETPISQAAALAPDAAASWQAAMNAAQSVDAPGQPAQIPSEPAQSSSPDAQQSAAAAPVAQSGQDKPSTAKPAPGGTLQDGASAMAKRAQQRHSIIAPAAGVQVEKPRANPQDKARHDSPAAISALVVLQQTQLAHIAPAHIAKVAAQAGGKPVPEVAKPATPEAAPAAVIATPVGGGHGSAPAEHARDTPSQQDTSHSSGQTQPSLADLSQAASAAPVVAAMPVPAVAQPRAQNAAPATTTDTVARAPVTASVTTGSLQLKVMQEAVSPVQPVKTGGDSGKAASISPPSGFAVPVAHFGVDPQNIAASNAPAEAAGRNAQLPAAINASAAGLAATVTVMHQSGQAGATFRLDPPGLGSLAVHVALGRQGQVNVLFVPSSQAAGTALQSGLPGLGQALAQSGLTLGQAQVGGQFNQNAGQGGQQQNPRGGAPATFAAVEPAAPTAQNGVSAYA